MKTFGATTFMIGLGQAMFQFYLLMTGGYWSRFTLGDLFAEFHIHSGYGMTWWDQLRNTVLGFEFSFTLLFLGSMLVVCGPFFQAFQQWHGERMVEEAQANRLRTAQQRSR